MYSFKEEELNLVCITFGLVDTCQPVNVLTQGYTNLGWQVTMVIILCAVTPNIFGS
jgi:hypothetical protein